MLARVILTLVSLAMFGFTLRTKNKRYILLCSALTLGVLLSWSGITELILGGIILFMFTALIVSSFQLNHLNIKNLGAISLFLTGIWSFTLKLFFVMNWPYQEKLIVSLVIPVMLFVICLFHGMQKQKEFGFWVILIAEFGIQISLVVANFLD
jgi:hypothetical protein